MLGEVYLAQHPSLPRRDALKLLPRDWSAGPDYRVRFNREADLASTLWHPHIVGVHDRGECEGKLLRIAQQHNVIRCHDLTCSIPLRRRQSQRRGAGAMSLKRGGLLLGRVAYGR